MEVLLREEEDEVEICVSLSLFCVYSQPERKRREGLSSVCHMSRALVRCWIFSHCTAAVSANDETRAKYTDQVVGQCRSFLFHISPKQPLRLLQVPQTRCPVPVLSHGLNLRFDSLVENSASASKRKRSDGRSTVPSRYPSPQLPPSRGFSSRVEEQGRIFFP